MRIISSFHDYYDCGMSQGMDDDIVYIREDRIVREPFKSYYDDNYYESCGQALYSFGIGFCGKLYKCMEWNGECFYSYEKLEKAFKDNGLELSEKSSKHLFWKKNIFSYFNNTKEYIIKHEPRTKSKGSIKRELGRKKETERGGLKWNYVSRKSITDFEQYHSPIIVYMGKGEIHIDCCLKKYDFYKVKDPYTAFQELYCWFANIAHPEPPIPDNLTQKEWAEIKGFDKWSFRKMPSSKKRKL